MIASEIEHAPKCSLCLECYYWVERVGCCHAVMRENAGESYTCDGYKGVEDRFDSRETATANISTLLE